MNVNLGTEYQPKTSLGLLLLYMLFTKILRLKTLP